MAGLATLFTRDFFEIARNRLNEDGIFVQWLHSYQLDWPTLTLVGRTFAEIFPNSVLAVTNPSGLGRDFLLIGFKGKDGLNPEYARQNVAYAAQSGNVILTDPVVLYRQLVSENLPALFGQGPVHTDNRPLLEFSAPRLMYRSDDPAIFDNLVKKRTLGETSKNIILHSNADVDSRLAHAMYALSVYKPFRNMVDPSELDSGQARQYIRKVEKYCAENIVRPNIFDEVLARLCLKVQIHSLESRLDEVPYKAASYTMLGTLYSAEGNADMAIRYYSKSLQIDGDNAPVRASLGAVLVDQGRPDEAIFHFMEALKIDPYYAATYNNLGIALMNLGRSDEGILHFQAALRLDPDYKDALKNLDRALARIGTDAAGSGP
jgi:spermidine synthase